MKERLASLNEEDYKRMQEIASKFNRSQSSFREEKKTLELLSLKLSGQDIINEASISLLPEEDIGKKINEIKDSISKIKSSIIAQKAEMNKIFEESRKKSEAKNIEEGRNRGVIGRGEVNQSIPAPPPLPGSTGTSINKGSVSKQLTKESSRVLRNNIESPSTSSKVVEVREQQKQVVKDVMNKGKLVSDALFKHLKEKMSDHSISEGTRSKLNIALKNLTEKVSTTGDFIESINNILSDKRKGNIQEIAYIAGDIYNILEELKRLDPKLKKEEIREISDSIMGLIKKYNGVQDINNKLKQSLKEVIPSSGDRSVKIEEGRNRGVIGRREVNQSIPAPPPLPGSTGTSINKGSVSKQVTKESSGVLRNNIESPSTSSKAVARGEDKGTTSDIIINDATKDEAKGLFSWLWESGKSLFTSSKVVEVREQQKQVVKDVTNKDEELKAQLYPVVEELNNKINGLNNNQAVARGEDKGATSDIIINDATKDEAKGLFSWLWESGKSLFTSSKVVEVREQQKQVVKDVMNKGKEVRDVLFKHLKEKISDQSISEDARSKLNSELEKLTEKGSDSIEEIKNILLHAQEEKLIEIADIAGDIHNILEGLKTLDPKLKKEEIREIGEYNGVQYVNDIGDKLKQSLNEVIPSSGDRSVKKVRNIIGEKIRKIIGTSNNISNNIPSPVKNSVSKISKVVPDEIKNSAIGQTVSVCIAYLGKKISDEVNSYLWDNNIIGKAGAFEELSECLKNGDIDGAVSKIKESHDGNNKKIDELIREITELSNDKENLEKLYYFGKEPEEIRPILRKHEPEMKKSNDVAASDVEIDTVAAALDSITNSNKDIIRDTEGNPYLKDGNEYYKVADNKVFLVKTDLKIKDNVIIDNPDKLELEEIDSKKGKNREILSKYTLLNSKEKTIDNTPVKYTGPSNNTNRNNTNSNNISI